MKTYTFDLVPKAKVIIGDDEYVLAIDTFAIRKWGEVTGKDLLGKGESPETADEIIALFWAAALLYQPDITREDVDHLLHPGNYTQMSEVLTALLVDVLPDPEGGEAKN